MEFIIGILTIIIIVLGYINWNLLRKLERFEEYVESFSSTVSSISAQLKEVDNSGMFESDDEIGWFFKEIKNLGDRLDQYRLK
jgi:hypothetical protein